MPRMEDEQEIITLQNSWYINDSPTMVIFTPYTETSNLAGGTVRTAGTPRLPQKVRLIASDRQRTRTDSVQESNSKQTEVPLMIMGMPDLEVERGDRFTLDGVEYFVTEIQPPSSAPYIQRVTAYCSPPDEHPEG